MITMIESISDPNTIFIFRPNGGEVEVNFSQSGEVVVNKPLQDDEVAALTAMARNHNVSAYSINGHNQVFAVFKSKEIRDHLTFGLTYMAERTNDPTKLLILDNSKKMRRYDASMFKIV